MKSYQPLWVMALVTGILGCTTVSDVSSDRSPVPENASVLQGWKTCMLDCGQSFMAAYNMFVFRRVDDQVVGDVASVTVSPGRHWVEAHYAWGGGITALGMGNFRGYGFELDVVPGHRYAIRKVPEGCIVPVFRTWVSSMTLQVEDQTDNAQPITLSVKAMQHCSPHGEPGSCKTNDDCKDLVCSPFGGTTGYGLCGSKP